MRFRLGLASAATLCLALSACVTINIYFPAAAAEKAADRIIDEVWQIPQGCCGAGEWPGLGRGEEMTYFRMLVLTMLAVIAPLVCAQGNLDVSTPAIVAIQSAMQARHANLAPLYDSGAIGLTRDGKVALRDASSVPLPSEAH